MIKKLFFIVYFTFVCVKPEQKTAIDECIKQMKLYCSLNNKFEDDPLYCAQAVILNWTIDKLQSLPDYINTYHDKLIVKITPVDVNLPPKFCIGQVGLNHNNDDLYQKCLDDQEKVINYAVHETCLLSLKDNPTAIDYLNHIADGITIKKRANFPLPFCRTYFCKQ